MNRTDRELRDLIDRYLKWPSDLAFVAARDRVRDELLSMPAHLQKPRIDDHAPVFSGWRVGLSLAAAAALIVLVATVSFQRTNWLATVEAADGSRYTLAANTTVRADAADGTLLTLKDGSRVEMRSQSELSLERTDDGIGIRLNTGGIIVDAVKQRTGHLSVHTRDVTASVVGTVFLVNAADDGSRVGVIEGEVRVRERGTPLSGSGRQEPIETTLRPGEQVSTSPALGARPLTEAVAWSRRGDAYAAILAAFEKGIAETSGPLRSLNDAPAAVNAAFGQAGSPAASQEFEEASIRTCDPDNLPPTPAGARGGGANSFQMTPGRTYALCMTPATLIRTAYGYGPANLDFMNGGQLGGGRGPNQFNTVYGLGVEDGIRVRGGPDWVRSERYTIEAVAGGPADAETMRGPMLRTLLEKRFQLRAHVETEQMPAWTLTIAGSGLKIKPVETGAVDTSGFVNTAVKDGGACEAQPAIAPGQPVIIRSAQPGERQPPPPSPGQPVTILFRHFADVRRGEKPTCGMSVQRNGPNQVIVAGGMTLEALARNLASALGGVVVTDKTGNTDKFNFVMEFVRDENTPGRLLTLNEPEPSSDVPRGPTIFTALEQQLGLRLEPAQAPREYIVIDAIERPAPN